MGLKQVIVIRRDLKMRRGKEIAQGSHASMAFIVARLKPEGKSMFRIDRADLTDPQVMWMEGLFTKVCCQVESEQELLSIHAKAMAAGIESHVITDSGLTEFGGTPTQTCLAIGPDYAEKVDAITGELKLY